MENKKTDARLGVKLPEAFLARMERLLGAEYEAFAQSYDENRTQGLRLNPLKGQPDALFALCRDRFGLRPVPWCREGFFYDAETRPGRHPFHEAGVYYIQEPSAMAVAGLLDPQPGERILDLCAAPGGKTTQIAGRMLGKGLLVSNEIHPARARILSQNVERMGISNCIVTNEPPEALSAVFPAAFDRICVDAPCSGEGMFRKDEAARAEWSPEHVLACAGRQRAILEEAAVMLKPGGRLVYSTCTFAPEEDEAVVAGFLAGHPEFSAVCVPEEKRLPGLDAGRPDWCPQELPEAARLAAAETFRIWPQRAGGEGHYLALLEKNGEPQPEKSGRKTKKNPRVRDPEVLRAAEECLNGILKGGWPSALRERLILFGGQLYLLPEGAPGLSGLRVLRPGLHLGTVKKNRMEPSHALALALRPEEVQSVLDLPAEGAGIGAYLAGEALTADGPLKGWTLITAGGCSVGWGKAAGGTVKNHYPKGLRRTASARP